MSLQFLNNIYQKDPEYFAGLANKQFSEKIAKHDEIQQIIQNAHTKLGSGRTKTAYQSKMEVDGQSYDVALLAIDDKDSIPNVLRELFIINLIHHPSTIKTFRWYYNQKYSFYDLGINSLFYIVEELGKMTLDNYCCNNTFQPNIIYSLLLILY